ncbi:FAD-binding domain-containing protein [Roseovarius aestuariivivens]|uniref:FAD-binding domain-containing protein n=1 Tax=Roseovarius aestuariivivens TaxID=1888910 RepID=UPI0010816CA1|nr:deoxyribodipyrimidine photo-lyase [Roseovarius aestuariivivens]
MQVVWFKRDLRVHDHRALVEAAQRGPVLPLYVIEPDLWAEPDMAGRHWAFIAESLEELQSDLAGFGQPLVLRRGEVTQVLDMLHEEHGIDALWSHEETGNDWTFRRDRRVAAWCRDRGLAWHELQNHGVIRRLGSRNGWAKQWDSFMAEPVREPPALHPLEIEPGGIPSADDLGLGKDPCPDRQRGGRKAALACRDSFLFERGEPYRKAMSSPLDGATACSRISPHLAWGTVSMREMAQATWARQRALKAQPGRTGGWRPSLNSFTGRLHWHCHFMQKLEDEPRIEFENLHSAYDGMRPAEPDAARLAAWEQGETGLPFLDACMRSLRHTGWLNFRMRAMVMAVSSYHLWLHWRAPGLALARMFTDYEPGIHWSQTQMQSGTTGINTVRIYNPVKQGKDQDPDGVFTRRWLPELAEIPDKHLQEPWKAENAGKVLGKTYPHPIVDHLEAAKAARQKVWAVRRGSDYRAAAEDIQEKHGSRKSGIPNRGQRGKAKTETAQMSFPFDGNRS